MGFDKKTIRIDSLTPGWSLDVWQALPKGSSGPWPTVVMAHGFSLSKTNCLEPFADAFIKAGFACLLFDYRHWGASDGQPRNVLSPRKEVDDYHTVIEWARAHPEAHDPERIGVWGTSYSGGHAFTVAAEDNKLAFGMSECPLVDGVASALVQPPLHALKMGLYSLASFAIQAAGYQPIYMPSYGKYKSWAFICTSDAYEGYERLGGNPNDAVANRVDTTVVLSSLFYRPTASASKIKCPFLCCIGETDTMTPVEAARKCTAKVEKGEVFNYRGGHCDPYKGGIAHDDVVKAQVEFLKRVAR